MREPSEALLDGVATIVTGAGRGIGAVLGRELAARGARVTLAARSTEQIEQVAEEIRSAGGEATAIPVDVADADSVDGLVTQSLEHWGSVDALVNNAGIITYAPISETTPADWDSILATNAGGVFRCTRSAASVMQAGASIVNIASVFGQRPVRGYAAYCASKAAILHFTRVAALEFAQQGIRVNALAPGYVESDLNVEALADPKIRESIEKRVPMSRIATPEELVPLVAYLCSPDSSYVTGSTFTIDGGFALR